MVGNTCAFCHEMTWVKFNNETHEFGPKNKRYSLKDLSGEKCLSCEELIYNKESSVKVIEAINQEYAINRRN